jgi:hypothetical protein
MPTLNTITRHLVSHKRTSSWAVQSSRLVPANQIGAGVASDGELACRLQGFLHDHERAGRGFLIQIRLNVNLNVSAQTKEQLRRHVNASDMRGPRRIRGSQINACWPGRAADDTVGEAVW